MNIAELLKKYAKKGDVFYTTICGNVPLLGCDNDFIQISENGWCDLTPEGCLTHAKDAECVIFPSNSQRDWAKWAKEKEAEKKQGFKKDDYIKVDYNNGVIRLGKIVRICKSNIVVNPLHKELEYELSVFKDKNNYKIINKWSADMFKAGQLVLARDADSSVWCLSVFSDILQSSIQYPYRCINYATYAQCIPYNFETKELLGTKNKPNDFYIF